MSEIQLTVFSFLPSYPYSARKSNYIWEVDVKSSDMRNREATLNEYDNFRIILTVGYNCAAFEIGGRFLLMMVRTMIGSN